jgi:hypothetical protein
LSLHFVAKDIDAKFVEKRAILHGQKWLVASVSVPQMRATSELSSLRITDPTQGETMKFVFIGIVGRGGAAVPEGYGVLFSGKHWNAAKRVGHSLGWEGPNRSDPAGAVADAWIHATDATPATPLAREYAAHLENEVKP